MREYIPVCNRREVCKVYVKDILYLEQQLRKIRIVTREREHSQYGKVELFSEYLGDSFFQCRKGLIINLDRVVAMREQTISFENDRILTLGRDNFTAAKQRFSRHLLEESGIRPPAERHFRQAAAPLSEERNPGRGMW